jgi:hypothetical protein
MKKCPHCQGQIVVRNSQPLTDEAASRYDVIITNKQSVL